jgi:hypothetical protein
METFLPFTFSFLSKISKSPLTYFHARETRDRNFQPKNATAEPKSVSEPGSGTPGGGGGGGALQSTAPTVQV